MKKTMGRVILKELMEELDKRGLVLAHKAHVRTPSPSQWGSCSAVNSSCAYSTPTDPTPDLLEVFDSMDNETI